MKYYKIFAFILLVLLGLILSCSSNSNKEKVSSTETTETSGGSTSGIIDQSCSLDPNIKFSYYLPKSFEEGKKYPILLLFDPQGNGHFAINKYTEAANQFEYILMSTNAIKNGLDGETAGHAMQTLLGSISSQLPVNPNRVYVGGFSGGARYAAMLAMSGSGIQGLMVAGAGFPVESWKNLSPSIIVAAANDGDMNLPEILALEEIKDKEQRSRVLIMRDKGIHEWPSLKKMQESLAIFTAYAVRDSIEKDKKKLDVVLSFYDSLDKSDYCAASKIYKSLFYERILKTLVYQKEVDKYGKAYGAMIQSADYLAEKNAEQNLIKEELGIKNSYYAAMGTKDTTWWFNEMQRLNSRIQSEKNNLKQAQLMRVRNGLSLMCYMNLDKTLKANSNQDAYYLSVLYRNIDPDNKEAWFLAAVMEARMGNKLRVIDFLNTAGKKGFNDRARMNQTTEFNSLLGDPLFQDAVNKLPN
jgi:predicted esterase